MHQALWKKKYEGYLLAFQRWLQRRADFLNIFIKISDNGQSYIVEDVIIGRKEITGYEIGEDKCVENSRFGEMRIRDKADFAEKIAHANEFMVRKSDDIISEAEFNLADYTTTTGDLIIINCYEKDMIITSRAFYCDGKSYEEACLDPYRYPPHFWRKRGIDMLGESYNEEELAIVLNDYPRYGIKFKTGKDIP
jgi:hypothetical protein